MVNRPLAVYGMLWLVGLIGFFAFPSPADDLVWAGIGLCSAAAVAYGVVSNRPARAGPWWLLCTAIVLLFLGDTLYDFLVDTRGVTLLFPSAADVFYLAMYPVLAAGLLRMAGPATHTRRRLLPLDTMILVTGLGLLTWIFLITPHLIDPTLSPAQRLLSVAYPVGDVLILATIGRLIVIHRFSPAVTLMTVGATGLLVTDLVYAMSQLRGHGPVGGPIDIGWLLFYGGCAAAALHPSMTALTLPPATAPRELSPARQASLLAASLLPSALLLLEAARGRVWHTPAIAVFASVTAVLVAIRLFSMIADHRRFLTRAEILRTTSTRLVAAHDVQGVRDCLAAAVDQLAPARKPHAFHLDTTGHDAEHGGSGHVACGSRVIDAGELPAAQAARMRPFRHVLVCPLVLDARPGGDPHLGAILVGADRDLLYALQSAVETIAAQAALALERISLTRLLVQRDSEEYFRALVQNAADVILILEPDGLRIRYASPSAKGVFGPGDLLGAELVELVAEESQQTAREQIKTAPPGADGDRGDWVIVRTDGLRVQVEAICRDLRAEPAVVGFVVTLRDVTTQRDMERELAYHAYHDSLTGLANRVAFQRRLADATVRAQGTGVPAAVIFIDLDDFKLVNDTFGHDYGDRLLRLVAERIVEVVRRGDTAARLGGDEFAVSIEDAPEETVYAVADRITAALARPFVLDGSAVSGRGSAGVSFSTASSTAAELLRQADVALYAAKAEGKGRWLRYRQEYEVRAAERMRLRAALETALPNGEFFMEFQPIVALADERTVGFEALLRWNHPTRGRLMPGEFIEIAEESQAIVAIGNWAMSAAVTAAAAWPHGDAGCTPYVSVNVSARQFRAGGFTEHVRQVLAESGLPACRLMLEITETLLLGDDEQVWQDLAALRQAGVRVAIDDFGTGYSALNYLRHIPLDVLKLDRVFTSSLTTSQHQADLVDGIITLAQKMHLDTVAEGVELTGEHDLLRRLGCGYGQGYLFARPMSAEAAGRWATTHAGRPH
ncbi:EAL domain-containing protein [Catellatospora citrea]|uniref:putative bifunctional diguanylate cyclase/phosphodiesterase n=1 Tax=Catellatospora citrea TaxID=53366 RepID=UPI0033CD2025